MIYAYFKRDINFLNNIFKSVMINKANYDSLREVAINPIATLSIPDNYYDIVKSFVNEIIKSMCDDYIINDFGDIHEDDIMIIDENFYNIIQNRIKFINTKYNQYKKQKFNSQSGNIDYQTEMELKLKEAGYI